MSYNSKYTGQEVENLLDQVKNGSGGSSSGGSGAYAEVNHGTGDTTFSLTPNTFHVWDEVASLDLSFANEQAGIANEYLFQFTSGATATTLTLPNVKWANDSAPTIAENKIYQISVLKGLASVLEFSNATQEMITFNISEISYQAEKGITWGEWCNSEYNIDGYYVSNGVVHKDETLIVVSSISYASALSSDIIEEISYTVIPG